MTRVFDLKGSVRNRYVNRKQRDETRVLLDQNFMECKSTGGTCVRAYDVHVAVLCVLLLAVR